MSRRPVLIGCLTIALLAAYGALPANGQAPAGLMPSALGACGGNPGLFPRGRFWEWQELYDARVRAVIDQHATRRRIQCTDLAEEPPSFPLTHMARQLPPWQDGQMLTEQDMAAVLIEHLRVYRCAMEEAAFRQVEIPDTREQGILDLFRRTESLLGARERVRRESIAAPRALERTLKVLAGTDRLRALESGMECLARTSLDIRNALGLAAETAACLPRAWDARTSLRTPAPRTSP